MIDIERLSTEFKLTHADDEVYFSFSFFDMPGTLRKASISVHALKELSDALFECQTALLQNLSGTEEVAVSLRLGTTRGESYLSEAN